MSKRIFIAATMQNDGKTTISLGLIAALAKRFPRIGFIKPIGQRYLVEQGYKVDEDSVLIEEVFGIKCNIKDMSPIAIDKGFTERYVEKGCEEDYAKVINSAFDKISNENDLVIIEGTGHAGVGSVFGYSNATVARLLGARVILISSGGVGKPIDEVMLNKALFDKEGVEIAGIIVNKVLPEKYAKISRLVRMGLESKDLNVLGVLPYQRILDIPTMREIREEIKIDILFPGEGLDIPAEHIIIGAMNVKDAVKYFKDRTMLIIPGDRDDIIEAACRSYAPGPKKNARIVGIIVSGGLMPELKTLKILEESHIPTLITAEDTYTIASRVHSMVVKLKPQDTEKIKIIVDMVEKYVDIDTVLSNLR